MIKNSIEEDIKIIEDFILKTDVDYSEYNEQIIGDISYQAIQHLLSAYQEVLKENKELKNDYENLSNSVVVKNHYIENSIPIQKVKDKIEELNRKIDKSIDNSKGGLDEEFIEKSGELLTQKRILQELLERRKENEI